MDRTTSGFTFMDLMVTLAVIGVVLGIGVPVLTGIYRNAQASTAFSQMTISMANARITAVSRNQPVTLCPSSDGESCRSDLVWDAGWITYLDPARGPQPASVDKVLRHVGPVTGVAIRSTPGRHRVRFLPDGMASGTNLTVRLCSTSQSLLLGQVLVSNAGRPRAERPSAPAACPYPL